MLANETFMPFLLLGDLESLFGIGGGVMFLVEPVLSLGPEEEEEADFVFTVDFSSKKSPSFASAAKIILPSRLSQHMSSTDAFAMTKGRSVITAFPGSSYLTCKNKYKSLIMERYLIGSSSVFIELIHSSMNPSSRSVEVPMEDNRVNFRINRWHPCLCLDVAFLRMGSSGNHSLTTRLCRSGSLISVAIIVPPPAKADLTRIVSIMSAWS